MNFSLDTKNSTKGFSLIEVLVSLSIFTIVVTVSVGTLLVLIDANTKSQSQQNVMTNVTFALDSMVRDIRTGSDYYCDDADSNPNPDSDDVKDCAAGDTFFAFNEGGNSLTAGKGSSRIAYRLSEIDGVGAIERRLGTGSWSRVTAPLVDITDLRFTLTGSARLSVASDVVAPTLTIYITGQSGGAGDLGADFVIQTTVAQLLLDI
ncbi:prepilin-type N-terminal cleavage/methylation domain-containing protein [Candidatus Kaiserbacteria bacterium]|nr:prepilin-type N-terminal cleavage/methylation domain-containing protein [Candidatus Kaiserbacteria bacterium]